MVKSSKIGGPVLGYDDVRIHAAQRYGSRALAGRDDAAHGASIRGSRERDDAQAAASARAARKIRRPAGPGHQAGGANLGVGLPEKVNLHRGIERHEILYRG